MKLSTLFSSSPSFVLRTSSFVLAGVALAAATATANATPAVGQVLVHQLWPWSQNVKVEYTLSGTEGGTYDIAVTAAENGVAIDAAKLSSALCGGEGFHGITGDGIHTFTLDPSKLVANGATAIGNFTVSITVAGPGDPLGYRVEYRVFDLETGDVTDLTRRDIYDHPELYGSTVITNYADVGAGFTKPADLPAEDVFIVPGFNTDEFKTTKLVMKRIPAKDVVWWMGPSENDPNAVAAGTDSSITGGRKLGESRFQATFSDDYYIGIFELTQKQYSLLMDGANPSFYSNQTYWATRPLENYTYNDFKFTFLPAARTALGKEGINMPTEAQWEFAAKAMYDGPGYPHGLELGKDNYVTVEGMVNGASDNGRYSVGNGESPAGGGSGTLTVGSGKPNPFGIYNMFGNVSEFVSELYANKNLGELYATQIAQGPVSDPYCSTSQSIGGSNSYRIIKGCNFRLGSPDYRNRSACRQAVKNSVKTMGNESDHVLGFRLACPAD